VDAFRTHPRGRLGRLDPLAWTVTCPPPAGGIGEHVVVRLARAADLAPLPLGVGDAGGTDLDAGADDDVASVRQYTLAVARADVHAFGAAAATGPS
jgi:hypothetical protein